MLPKHFRLAQDSDYKLINAYGLRWDAPNETAYSASFVIDGKGIVRYGKVSLSHGGRAKADDLLKALRSSCSYRVDMHLPA